MKQERIVGLVLGVANIILIIVCLFSYIRMDRTVPVIEFQANNMVYVPGTTAETKLFDGITAYDSNDGDITDRIVIEKMIEDEEESTIVVFYAVCDKAGNVAKASREFEARFLKKNKEEVVNEIKEAGIEAELVVEIQEDSSEEAGEDADAVSEENESSSAEETANDSETQTEEIAAPPAEEVQPEQQVQEQQPQEAPVTGPEQAPAPQPEEAPVTQPEQAPAPQPEEAPVTQSEQAPAPQPEQAPAQ